MLAYNQAVLQFTQHIENKWQTASQQSGFLFDIESILHYFIDHPREVKRLLVRWYGAYFRDQIIPDFESLGLPAGHIALFLHFGIANYAEDFNAFLYRHPHLPQMNPVNLFNEFSNHLGTMTVYRAITNGALVDYDKEQIIRTINFTGIQDLFSLNEQSHGNWDIDGNWLNGCNTPLDWIILTRGETIRSKELNLEEPSRFIPTSLYPEICHAALQIHEQNKSCTSLLITCVIPKIELIDVTDFSLTFAKLRAKSLVAINLQQYISLEITVSPLERTIVNHFEHFIAGYIPNSGIVATHKFRPSAKEHGYNYDYCSSLPPIEPILFSIAQPKPKLPRAMGSGMNLRKVGL